MAKTYAGTRDGAGTCHVTVIEDGASKPLDPRLDIFNHSPTGFEWGYAGSGPAQLALAIMADVLGNARQAMRLHQRFKFDVVARLQRDRDWELTHETVMANVRRLQQSNEREPS